MPPSRPEPLPRFLEPMLATSGGVPEGPGWAAEVKWDGLRGQLRHDGRRTTLRSRNGHDLSSAFPDLVAEAGSGDEQRCSTRRSSASTPTAARTSARCARA